MAAHLCRSLRLLLVLMLAGGLSACALFQARDPLTISVIGIEPLPGQELEMRMAVKMRVQNPNESAIDYSGIALNLEVNGQPLASGVSDQQGRIGRYDEAVIVVPVSITAFAFLRQAYGLGKLDSLQGMPYKLRGKLAGGPFGTVRFTDEGKLDLPKEVSLYW
ncbi:LEA type 2 family protein [Pseudomonas fluorescens]|uniref:LEA type 2 family protein n=1 Tax=Pseudomonas fluorescens TaxID=294 RepID=UPI0020C3EC80|nr:LEA type 2 family protein [Pseudomonas fluorescens]UTL92974.1 LEA type 2 family protein [Pseudomonas fluorescens]